MRRSGRNDIKLQKKREVYSSYFLGVARFFAAALTGGAVVLVTRPDLVLPMTLGCSTTAGALGESVGGSGVTLAMNQLTAVVVLRALPELALGRPAAFLAVVVFLTAAVLGPGLAAAFLGAATFLVVVALVAVFWWKMSVKRRRAWLWTKAYLGGSLGLRAGLSSDLSGGLSSGLLLGQLQRAGGTCDATC